MGVFNSGVVAMVTKTNDPFWNQTILGLRRLRPCRRQSGTVKSASLPYTADMSQGHPIGSFSRPRDMESENRLGTLPSMPHNPFATSFLGISSRRPIAPDPGEWLDTYDRACMIIYRGRSKKRVIIAYIPSFSRFASMCARIPSAASTASVSTWSTPPVMPGRSCVRSLTRSGPPVTVGTGLT